MQYIGPDANFANNQVYTYTAAGGETSISGPDNSGALLVFTSGANLQVTLNGTLLIAGTDYNTSTANTIAGLTALSASDSVVVTVYRLFNGSDAMPLTGGEFSGPVGLGGVPIYEIVLTVSTDYTITDGRNAMSAGPITIASGVTVTVGTGETWTVV